MRGTSGVEGTMWGTTKVVGATRGPGEAGEVDDEGMTQVLAVRPPKVVV
jgi:hypothetical protein